MASDNANNRQDNYTQDENRSNPSETTSKNVENGESKSDVSTFNLADPDQLIRQLEKVELTEEDTEELLKEAYKMNMKLREIYSKQESKRQAKMSKANSAYKSASVLPPIRKKASTEKAKTSPKHQTSPKQKSRPRSTSASKRGKGKPEWDDRFSFS